MDRAFILAELQKLIDTLHIEGYRTNLVRLTVQAGGQSFDAVLKDPQPTPAAADARVVRNMESPY